jgi:hypothetical protein
MRSNEGLDRLAGVSPGQADWRMPLPFVSSPSGSALAATELRTAVDPTPAKPSTRF